MPEKGQTMRTDLYGLERLQQLRQQLQEDTGETYPQGVMRELLVLYDVGKALDMTYFELRSVMGVDGFKAVTQHINSHELIDVPVQAL